mmetsp:Transcript_24414/g.39658  ORF Transcript_24414/g.39658 Transcript_24414/m.39658 type:complete len:85 (-) Transcript_24414:3696-3950(-)
MGTGKMEFGAKVYSAAAWSAKVATSSGEDWNASNGKGCVRIFVSGDRSQVGKSNVELFGVNVLGLISCISQGKVVAASESWHHW